MASITHTINANWQGQNGTTVASSYALSGTFEDNANPTISATTTNQEVVFEVPESTLQEFYLVSDQNVNMFVNAPSTGSPILTVSLVAGQPFIWHALNYLANPFSANVTAIYFTNTGSVAANVKIRSLHN